MQRTYSLYKRKSGHFYFALISIIQEVANHAQAGDDVLILSNSGFMPLIRSF